MVRLYIALLCLALLASQAVTAATCPAAKDQVRIVKKYPGDFYVAKQAWIQTCKALPHSGVTLFPYYEGTPTEAGCNTDEGVDYGCQVLEKLGSGWELATPSGKSTLPEFGAQHGEVVIIGREKI
ncbi:hypothetical protein IE81DRAFT_332653 [Ceraceosorus guamensis]|uniref:Uncharacterized protein n=1 Tax=Ceraceosorus guamensis TaxID=1522189 RepID=A0A316VU02_9BASI|nr:hypothetical protein IE81DRAFT_332653 [Ceraceosorus guamensis]PWN38985.1 hypothetical protein IE81DRAFT_332653 [Ceraceosorus guamensis]